MKLTFIGCGSAFNKQDGQSNMILTSDSGKNMLVDCGSYCPMFLKQMGINEIDYVNYFDSIYISHAHGDHLGGLEEIAFISYFLGKGKKIKLYCASELMSKIWTNSLQGGLSSLEGKIMHLTDYFDCIPVSVNEGFIWDNQHLQTVQTVHFMNAFEVSPSYGLMLGNKDHKNFITTDTQFCPNQIRKFYDMANIIFHDCETAPYKSGVHAHYEDLKTLPEECRNKMWLYHYQPNPTQEPEKDGFRGFVKRGQVYEI